MLDGPGSLETSVRILLSLALLLLPTFASARTMFPEEARALWRKQLLASSSLAAWHEETQLRPVPFPTKVKCRSMERIELGKVVIRSKRLDPLREWLAETIDHEKCHESTICDDADLDMITLSTGEDAGQVRIQFDPSRRRLDSWDQKGNWETTRLYRQDVDTLLALLRAAMPKDKMLYSSRFGCPPLMAGTYIPWPQPSIEARPEVTKMVAPSLPTGGAAAADTVVLHGLIDHLGRLVEIRIKHSVPELDQSAIEAVEQWHFNPGRNNGFVTSSWVTIRIPVRE